MQIHAGATPARTTTVVFIGIPRSRDGTLNRSAPADTNRHRIAFCEVLAIVAIVSHPDSIMRPHLLRTRASAVAAAAFLTCTVATEPIILRVEAVQTQPNGIRVIAFRSTATNRVAGSALRPDFHDSFEQADRRCTVRGCAGNGARLGGGVGSGRSGRDSLIEVNLILRTIRIRHCESFVLPVASRHLNHSSLASMNTRRPLRPSLLCLAVATALASAHVHADDAGDRSSMATKLDRLSVVGSVEKAHEAAGSAHYVGPEELEIHDYIDIHRVLRSIPGVYVVDEEGFGLRPNIGIRGSGTDRNSRITVMEDGVLIAPAAYAAPSAYYFPTTARMSAIEVRKGSSAIKAGPRTTGGAMNLISTPIPAAPTAGQVEFSYGTDASMLGHAWVGGSGERTGWLVETVQQASDGFKRLDSGEDTGFRLEDYLAKFRITSDPNADLYQELEFKAVQTDQDSDETYLGLTDADFDAHPVRRYAASQLDRIVTEHRQYEVRHRIEFNPAVDLTTVAYRHTFARNWYKLNDVQGTSIGAILADPVTHAERYSWLTGASSPADALRLRNNNRAYSAEGVQSVLAWALDGGSIEHQIEAGLRWHQDEEDRFQDDDRYQMVAGRLLLTTDGAPGTQDNRVGEAEAWSFFVQDEMRIGDWLVTPGLRYETIDLTRTDYARNAAGRDTAPTRVREGSVDQWIPGLGVTWLLSDTTNVFASMHRGFNPPGPGSDADPELSVNTEFGFRWSDAAWSTEVVGFWNDYSNLVGTCTASTGGGCTIGDQFDGGEATVRGVEASAGWDAGRARGWSVAVPLTLSYTWTDAQFDSAFESDYEEWGSVARGDELPYLPEHAMHAAVGVEGEKWRVNLGANFVDDMRTVAGQGGLAAGERTDQAWVFDLSAAYRLTDAAEVFARVENLGDEEYIVSRRPSGARPGRPRSSFVGVRVAF